MSSSSTTALCGTGHTAKPIAQEVAAHVRGSNEVAEETAQI
jgi:hypothetical protein